MKTSSLIGILGTVASLFGVGLTLILVYDKPILQFTGAVICFVAFLTPLFLWLKDEIVKERAHLDKSTSAAATQIATYTEKLEETVRLLGMKNDARFLQDGFIGLQRQAILIEENQETGNEHVRMAILGHLPSHVRLNPLTEERGRQLYENWEPPHLVNEYVRLVNRRSEALRRFIDNGGIVREIYDKAKLQQYVERSFTFHDKVKDPSDEQLERIRALVHFLDKHNYFISLVGDDDDRPGPHFLLKQNVGLVVDLRTTETQKHFTKSLDGAFTDSPKVLKDFEDKFSLAWRASEKDAVREFLTKLIESLKTK